MGLLIVTAVAVLGVTVAERLSRVAGGGAPVTVALPAGARLIQAVPGDGMLSLQLETASGPRLLVVDIASGLVVREIHLEPAP